jgi:hypothetical protein
VRAGSKGVGSEAGGVVHIASSQEGQVFVYGK